MNNAMNLILAASVLVFQVASADDNTLSEKQKIEGWKQLFDGKTIDGWSIKSGVATYKVEDGSIVGTTVKGSPNTFLCSDKKFGDF